MKSYTVTLAAFATIPGSITVEADSINAAIEAAVAKANDANWPLIESGDTIEVLPGYAFATYVHNDSEGGDRWPKFGHGLSPEIAARIALAKLQEARDLLKIAGAPRAMERVRLAITSAGGAVRHARGKAVRNEMAARSNVREDFAWAVARELGRDDLTRNADFLEYCDNQFGAVSTAQAAESWQRRG